MILSANLTQGPARPIFRGFAKAFAPTVFQPS